MFYFNSHAHVERDMLKWESDLLAIISTHTLTWSVTDFLRYAIGKIKISTHTLTWSVTGKSALNPLKPCDFNSHAHVERDKTTLTKLVYKIYFNSHAHVERDYSENCR